MTEDSIVDLVQKHQDGMGNQEAAAPAADVESQGLARKASAMSENIPVDRATEETLERLLENVKTKMAWIEVSLPSKGLLYPNGTKVVKIRPFTYDDERLLKNIAAAKKNPDDVIDSLLQNCVEGISVSELLPHDRLYVLFRLRGISYGDTYPLSHDCTKCDATSKLDLAISTLETTDLSQDHMIFTLPDSEKEVEIKLPRQQDNHLFKTPEALMENLHMFVYRIEDVKDKTIIEAFIHRTTVKDIDTLRTHIFTPEYGMETHFFYNCAGCGTKNRVEIELNEHFFTAS